CVCRSCNQWLKFFIKMQHRNRCACHFHGSCKFTNPNVLDLDAALIKKLRNATEHDVKLFQRRASKTVYQHGNLIALSVSLFGKNTFQQFIDNGICTGKLFAADAWFAMDTHADFHFIFTDREGCVTNFWYNTAGKCNAHGAGPQACLIGKTGDFIERQAIGSGGASCLIDEENTGNPTTLVFFTHNRGSYIIITDNLLNGNAVKIGKFSSHIEIDEVAAIITVNVENASALIDSLGNLINLF